MAIPRRRTLQELLSSIGAGAAPVYSGNVNAAGMPPRKPSRPNEWWQWASTQPGYNVGIKPQPLPTPSQPSHSDEWWQAASKLPGYKVSHGGIYQSDTGRPEPRPDFVPADWVYIGMGDWGPPPEQTVPGAEYGSVVDHPAGGLPLSPTHYGLLALQAEEMADGGGILGQV